MPIYEYECEACGEAQELNQKISDAPLTRCPLCGQEALVRLVSASSFALKGSGWYADGYGAAKKADKDADKGADKGDKKKEGGAEKSPKVDVKSSSGSD